MENIQNVDGICGHENKYDKKKVNENVTKCLTKIDY